MCGYAASGCAGGAGAQSLEELLTEDGATAEELQGLDIRTQSSVLSMFGFRNVEDWWKDDLQSEKVYLWAPIVTYLNRRIPNPADGTLLTLCCSCCKLINVFVCCFLLSRRVGAFWCSCSYSCPCW